MTGRVLFLTSNYPRWKGDSTTPFVHHLARDLIEQGWKVDVLAPHAPGAAAREVLDGVVVDRFRYLIPESAETVCYGGGALANLEKHPREALKLPALVAAQWAAVQRRLNAGAYDLLHSHWVVPQGFVGTLASGVAGVPHVITVHGSDVFRLGGGVMNEVKRFALRRASAVTVNSSATERRVREIAPDFEAALERVPMGISTDPLSASQLDAASRIRGRYGGPGGPLLIFLGRLVEQKGVADLLRAMRVVVDEVPQARLMVVGEGHDRKRFEELASQLELGASVDFVGWVDATEVRAYLAAADVLVGPSRGVEGQGLVFLEAMATDTAVIATRSGGVVDVVQDEVTGLLVEQESSASLARAIIRVCTEPSLSHALRAGAAQRIGEEFSRERCARRMASVYRALVAALHGGDQSR